MEGKVKFYDTSKNFGFIIGDEDKEYFHTVSGLFNMVALCTQMPAS